ncbi:MAG: SDR family NAD(P)-dependent oxidoreductase [Acidobacteriota bacterium]|nr:SDR family NAD(P)-dependent oxidoreductase [Acidobacteriota bacterium]MDE3169265.1 SDR family NAD(P)-dependent oxidoreductase [Acidobacteriota bacterium]
MSRGRRTIWNDRKVLVTGGASFIGSHLVDALVERGARVCVVDDLSSGKLGNIAQHLKSGRVSFTEADLRDPGVTRAAMKRMQTVFHLAADHGGRGYVDLHQAGPASNLFLDGLIFWEAVKAGVEKIVYASSGCVYPNYMQTDPRKEIYLREEDVKPPHDADNMYGWAKLMAELTLRAYHREFGIGAASCRYFTVYGPRGVENHAVIAMIARAFVGQNPFDVWGDGRQIRNWTHVDDIVRGTILAAEKVNDGTAINLGTMERVRVIDAARMVLEFSGHHAEIRLRPEMPTGPLNRVADNRLAKQLLGWEPEIPFRAGLKQTMDWYFADRKKDDVRGTLETMLTAR